MMAATCRAKVQIVVVLAMFTCSPAVAWAQGYVDVNRLAPLPPAYQPFAGTQVLYQAAAAPDTMPNEPAAEMPAAEMLVEETAPAAEPLVEIVEEAVEISEAKAAAPVVVNDAFDATPNACLMPSVCSQSNPCDRVGCTACCTSSWVGLRLADCMPRLECYDIEVGGWLSGGIYSNAWGARNNALPLREQAGGTFDQAWVYAEKKVDNGGCGIDIGGRVDFVFGADAPYTRVGPGHSTLPMLADPSDNGWDHEWTTSDDGVYGSALPQLYGEVAINRLTLKAGHFFTLIGYEQVPATENFFYSRSYAMGIEPMTHMGALASYDIIDGLEFTGGVTNGWDNGWLNPSDAVTGLGKLSADVTDNLSVDYALTFGDLAPGNQVYLHSIVLDWRITDRWEYVLQSDFMVDTDGAADVRQDYGMNQYLFYKLNNCWKIGTRVEWLRAESHNTVGFGTDVFETRTGVTLGVNYSPWDNLTIRPELRWDSASGRLGNDFNNRRNTYQFAGGLDVILRF